jgi:hypothetical protein
MYVTNEILFPSSIIPDLGESRGPEWLSLVERVQALPENHEEKLAFMLMMVRLNGCLECETDSYRAMKGCLACSLQTLRRSKASDDDLLKLYALCLEDIRKHLARSAKVAAKVLAAV